VGPVRLVALSHVLWTTGAVLPVAEIVRRAHVQGAAVVLDGAQASGAIPIRWDDLGAEFYAVPGQSGCSARRAWARWWCDRTSRQRPCRRPAAASAAPHGGALGRGRPLAGRARRFEAAGFHAPSVIGLARSAGWLAMYVGLPWAHARAGRLAADAAARLGDTPGVELVTPPGRMATLVTFRLPGWPAERVAEELARRGFASVRIIPALEAIRISVGFFTGEEELGRFLGAVGRARPPYARIPAATSRHRVPRAVLDVSGPDPRPVPERSWLEVSLAPGPECAPRRSFRAVLSSVGGRGRARRALPRL